MAKVKRNKKERTGWELTKSYRGFEPVTEGNGSAVGPSAITELACGEHSTVEDVEVAVLGARAAVLALGWRRGRVWGYWPRTKD